MNNFQFVKGRFLSFGLAAIISSFFLLLLFVDVLVLKNELTEISITEILQEIILTIIVSIFIFLAWKRPILRRGLVLIAGFFACMLVREFDFLFDYFKPYFSWFPLAVIIAVTCLYYAYKNVEETFLGLADFCASNSFYLMFCGLLIVLVFSRIMGISMLWEGALGDSYIRVVKNVFEEGSESFGYLICLLATVKYANNDNT